MADQLAGLIIHTMQRCAQRTLPPSVEGTDGGSRITARWPKVARNCEHCGGEFEAALYDVQRGKARFCRPACVSADTMRRRHLAKPQLGADNPGWKGGVSRIHVRYTNRFRAKFPEKARAHQLVYAAVKSGRLIRPESCSACGVDCKPHGHHDDYSKPLSVRWLCRLCHRIADRQPLPRRYSRKRVARFLHGREFEAA
jgi:hypothetical protein